ncbi:hypothetical protein SDJN02_20397 [Cucurbita argyrosperma subsp. argyrosperma]|nr:hypothetical protein SDJN02_20397 [Cucurbita argyrosperma subsp. argyrosperma]
MWPWSSWYLCMPGGCSCSTFPGFQCRSPEMPYHSKCHCQTLQKRLKLCQLIQPNLMLNQ